MTNRKLGYIVKEQLPIMLTKDVSVQRACHLMADRFVGSVLVVDEGERLLGIFTGRDAVRALAKGLDGGSTEIGSVMTASPVTISPNNSAIDALRMMWDGGFRHLRWLRTGGSGGCFPERFQGNRNRSSRSGAAFVGNHPLSGGTINSLVAHRSQVVALMVLKQH